MNIKTKILKPTLKRGLRVKATDSKTGISLVLSQDDYYFGSATGLELLENMHAAAVKELQIKLEQPAFHESEMCGIQIDRSTYLWAEHCDLLRQEVSNFDIDLARERAVNR